MGQVIPGAGETEPSLSGVNKVGCGVVYVCICGVVCMG